MRWPWQRREERPSPIAIASAAPQHVHDKRGDWAGDVWTFDEPDEDGAQGVAHVARWRCSCGEVWEETRDSMEYPHVLQNVKVR